MKSDDSEVYGMSGNGFGALVELGPGLSGGVDLQQSVDAVETQPCHQFLSRQTLEVDISVVVHGGQITSGWKMSGH